MKIDKTELNNISYEGTVTYNSSNIRLTICKENIILEKEKGLFNKKYKIIEKINISEIKMKKNKVYIEVKEKKIILYTIKKDYNFICKSIKDAKSLTTEIIDFKTGSNKIKRTTDKIIGGATMATNIYGGAKNAIPVITKLYFTWKDRKSK